MYFFWKQSILKLLSKAIFLVHHGGIVGKNQPVGYTRMNCRIMKKTLDVFFLEAKYSQMAFQGYLLGSPRTYSREKAISWVFKKNGGN